MTAAAPRDPWPLSCPLCGAFLGRAGGALACLSGHSFDVAREGYVNLLPPQHRTRGVEGDLAPMLLARRRFLGSGHYAPLLDLLADACAGELRGRAGNGPACVLEAGCGEGYYIGGIADRVGAAVREGGARFVGMDLSRPAARMASRRHTGVLFFVSDVNRRICVGDGTVAVLLNVFSPRNPAEFARVVRPGGLLLVAIPAPDHLACLRAALGLLSIQEDKEALVAGRLAEWFAPEGRRELRHPLALSAPDVADLVSMGPSSWHRPPGAVPPGPAETEASFVVLGLRRKGSTPAARGEGGG